MARLHRKHEQSELAPAEAWKILCVEDDHDIAKLIADELIERGYDVVIAHDGHEGFIAILKGLCDLVLCDIGLPNMSGFEMVDHLNKLPPGLGHVPFVFVTALADRETELRARHLGVHDCVTKPIDFDMLETTVKARLASVTAGEMWATFAMLGDREAEVLTWVARGKTPNQIAEMLGSGEQNVKMHLDNARAKLEVTTQPAAKKITTVGREP